MSVVDERCVYGFDYDYRTDAARIAAKHPDAVLMGYQEDRIIRRFTENGFHPKVLSTNNLAAVKLDKLLSDQELEGVYFTDWDPRPEFVAKFSAQYGRAPMFEAHNHYQVLHSVARAYAAGGQNLLSALKTIHFEGTAGPVDFSKGMAVNFGRAVLKKIVHGQVLVVQTQGRDHGE